MILDIFDIGVSQVDIAKYYDMPKSTVPNIVKCGRVEKKKKQEDAERKYCQEIHEAYLK